MEISVILPIYNSRETIVDALNSIRMQTVRDAIIEIIIINDGSVDDSMDVIRDYAKRHQDLPIRIIEQENRGVSAARNTGLQAAKGDWIAFLDSDDEWLPKKLERQIGIIRASPQIDFLGADAHEDGIRILWKHIDELYRATIKDLTLKSFPVTPSIIMRRKIFKEIGGFDETRNYMEDAHYCMKICQKYQYYHLPEKLVEIGHGKRPFGHKGLSANLKGMHTGSIRNIQELNRDGVISFGFYAFLRGFYWLKYCRRIVITKLSSLNRGS